MLTWAEYIIWSNLARPQLLEIIMLDVGQGDAIVIHTPKHKTIVIDAGLSEEGNSLHGDVDFESVSKRSSLITPVPGGVGPMTIAMLLKNTLLACERNYN